MNKGFIQKSKDIINSIPESNINPLDHYQKVIGHNHPKFEFKQISMHELRAIISNMTPTGSSGYDYISMRTVKNARKVLEPVLLNLINQVIAKIWYPDSKKNEKIVPILKALKEEIFTDRWRPIHLVPIFAKIIDKVLIKQLLAYMLLYKLIPSQHHSNIKGKSTVTALLEIHDQLSLILENGQEAAFISLDGKSVFKIISH